MTLNVLSTGPELFFLAQSKTSNLELKSPTNMGLSERLLMVSNSLRFGFSEIWVVNGSQNQVLAVRKVDVNHQGFVIGYDIKIYVTYSLLITIV